MTPEERALDLLFILTGKKDDQHSDVQKALVAKFIRDAENDALERAAKAVNSQGVYKPGPFNAGVCTGRLEAIEIILALKR